MTVCPNCKTDNLDTSNHCRKCGSSLPGRRKTFGGWLLVALFVAAAALVLTVVLPRGMSSDEKGMLDYHRVLLTSHATKLSSREAKVKDTLDAYLRNKFWYDYPPKPRIDTSKKAPPPPAKSGFPKKEEKKPSTKPPYKTK
jgi:hypothetical protein